jgi:hypothetical protein
MNKLIVAMLVLSALSGCENIYSPKNINLSCICIEPESTACSYDNQEVIVDFKKNIMTFASKTYSNLGTTPTSVSARDESHFVVLNRGTLRLTFEWDKQREIYQCDENKI